MRPQLKPLAVAEVVCTACHQAHHPRRPCPPEDFDDVDTQEIPRLTNAELIALRGEEGTR